jgi:hypothetical protein
VEFYIPQKNELSTIGVRKLCVLLSHFCFLRKALSHYLVADKRKKGIWRDAENRQTKQVSVDMRVPCDL